MEQTFEALSSEELERLRTVYLRRLQESEKVARIDRDRLREVNRVLADRQGGK